MLCSVEQVPEQNTKYKIEQETEQNTHKIIYVRDEVIEGIYEVIFVPNTA